MNRLLLGKFSDGFLRTSCALCMWVLPEFTPADEATHRGADPFQSVQLPDVVEEVLSEGITCSISFNRHGTILAGAAVLVLSKACCTAVMEAYSPSAPSSTCCAVLTPPCYCSRMPGWHDCPVGLSDPECGADPSGAQVHIHMVECTEGSFHDGEPASASTYCNMAAVLCAAARQSPGWSGHGTAVHSSPARSTVTSSGGTWSRAHRQGDPAHVHRTAVPSAAQLTAQNMTKPAKLTQLRCRARAVQTGQLCAQVADIDVGTMVSGLSTDEHADHICVASHISGPPDVIDLRTCRVHPLPSISTGGSCCSQLCPRTCVQRTECPWTDERHLTQPTATSNRCCRLCAEQESKGAAAAAAAAVTTHSGDRIFLSQARGVLLAVDTATMQIADAVKVSVAGAHCKQQTACSMHQAGAAAGCTDAQTLWAMQWSTSIARGTRCLLSSRPPSKTTARTLDRNSAFLLLPRRCPVRPASWRCRSTARALCCWRCAATGSSGCSRFQNSGRRPQRFTLLTPCAGRSPASRCAACPTYLRSLCTDCTCMHRNAEVASVSAGAIVVGPGRLSDPHVLLGSRMSVSSVQQTAVWFMAACLVRSG
jgi:hypothetical protein